MTDDAILMYMVAPFVAVLIFAVVKLFGIFKK